MFAVSTSPLIADSATAACSLSLTATIWAAGKRLDAWYMREVSITGMEELIKL